MIIEEMDTLKEKEDEYKMVVQQASTAYLNGQYNASLSKYNDALVLSIDIGASEMTKTLLKYMICLCLMESNKLQDLAEVVIMLQTVEKSLKDRFPDIYCLLAKAHCKLYRFDHAHTVINEGAAVLSSNKLFETLYIPGTNIALTSLKKEIWIKIRDECLSWHKPDAICNLENCCNITPPYETANKNIFLNDPAFNGMIIIYCNNKKRPCSLKYHQICWKFKKDQLYPITKISDKDILGNHCFTPNCQNDNIPCIISAIEVVGQDGEVKAHVKESTSAPWPLRKNTSKGAIKKVKVTSPKKIENSSEIDKYAVTVKRDIFDDKPISRNYYEEDQILAVKEEIIDVNFFSSEPPQIADQKNFLLSLFHDYIQNNLVRVSDAYKKFIEINEDMNLKNLDIMEFLMHTNKFEVLSKKSDQESYPSQNQDHFKTCIKTERTDQVNLNKTTDIEDMYNEFMNDDYEGFEMADGFHAGNQNSTRKKSQHTTSNENELHENYLSLNANGTNYGYDQAAGDTLQSTKNVVNNYTSYNLSYEPYSKDPKQKTSENHKLKEYIDKCELQIKNLLDKVCRLENELKIKDADIIQLTKNQELYSREVDKMCENLKVFQVRHEEIKEENLKIKKEMIDVLHENKALEAKVLELENSDSTRQDILKMFQEEYKILEERINEEWKEKTDKLTNHLEDQFQIKKSLLDKCLHYKYSVNRHIIKGQLDQCSTALDIICKINIWMESTLSIKNFVDNSEWFARLNFLRNLLANYQNEFSKILEKSEEIEIEEVDINLPHIPNAPAVSLSELVQNALNTFYKGQCQVMQNALKMQQQSMTYQMTQMQVSNVPYNQYSQQYPFGSAYPPVRQPKVIYPLMAPPMINQVQIQRMGLQPPPLIPQNYAQPVSRLVEAVTKANDEKLIESTTPNLEPDSSSSEGIASKMENLAIRMAEIKEEMIQEKKEKEEVAKNEKIVIEKEDSVKQSNDGISIRNEKMTKMKQACKAIALKIQQQTTLDNVNGERLDKVSNNQQSNVDNVKVDNIDDKENVETSPSLELASINTVSNSTVISSEENTSNQRKKIGIDGLIKMMKQKYPESLEVEIIEVISNIRRRHNNSLTRIPVNQILDESNEYMTQKHNLHTLRYDKVPGNKSNHNETPTKSSGFNQNGKKTDISPASSCNSLPKLEESPAQKKKTWNKLITQNEVQWTSSGEVECSICMSVVRNKANCYTLSCRHSFHKQCIKSWLKSDRSCPNCRVAVTEDDEFPPLPT